MKGFIKFLKKTAIYSSWLLICLMTLLRVSISPATHANPALPTDLSYSTETTWLLPGLPNLDATSGYIPHTFSQGETIFQIDNETIHGFQPGKDYADMSIRDIAWTLETAQYYYPAEYLRQPIEAYLRRQHPTNFPYTPANVDPNTDLGAIAGLISPQGQSHKQTITSDEETNLIHAAYLYYNLTYNTVWLTSDINGQPVIERLNRAADWLYTHRLDPATQLLWRGPTTDWGHIKAKNGPNYSHYNPAQDPQIISIYDQALAYMALLELAKMNAAVGQTQQADQWQNKAETLKIQANNQLWQTNKGFYLTRLFLSPATDNLAEPNKVSITNALAIYAGLTSSQQNKIIFQNLETARLAAKSKKTGLSIYPAYPKQYFDHAKLTPGNHQNGAVWDWWGGIHIKTEFLNGFSHEAITHLRQIANEWEKHPGNIIEWQSTTNSSQEGSHYHTTAAGTVGSAIIEGFFGVTLDGGGLILQPRLGLNDAYIRVYQAATDRYAAYSYDWNQKSTLFNYGTNTAGPITIKVLTLPSEHIQQVTIDGHPVEFTPASIAQDLYIIFAAPTGQHQVEIVKGPPPTLTVTTQTELTATISINSTPTPNTAQNLTSPHQIENQQEAALMTPSASDQTANYDHSQLTIIQIVTAILVLFICVLLIGIVLVRQARRLGFFNF